MIYSLFNEDCQENVEKIVCLLQYFDDITSNQCSNLAGTILWFILCLLRKLLKIYFLGALQEKVTFKLCKNKPFGGGVLENPHANLSNLQVDTNRFDHTNLKDNTAKVIFVEK
jgi:hypothetical protein